MAIANSDGSIMLSTKVDTSGVNQGMNSIKGAVGKIGGLMAAAFSVKMISNFAKESVNLYKIQMQNEVKLATVMRERVNATNDQIKSILDLTAAEQNLGIVGDEVQIAGLQQLATFAKQTETIETLLPAMNNLVAQQYGFEASTGSAVNVANLMGKVLQGQTGALTRVGITFTEAQEEILKYGTESEKAATLAQVITENVGEMNKALASTDVGRQQQLSNTIGDIKEQFGEAVNQVAIIFLPLLQNVASVLRTATERFREFASAIANVFGSKSNQSQWETIPNDIGEAAENEEELNEKIAETNKALKKTLAGFDDIQILSGGISKDESAETIVPEISGELWENLEIEETEKELSSFEKALKKIIKKIQKAFEPFTKISFSNLRNSLSSLAEPLKNLVSVSWDILEGAIEKIIAPLAEFVIEDALPRFFETFGIAIDGFRAIMDKSWAVIEQFIDEFLTPIWEYAEPKILEIWDNLNAKLQDFVKLVEESEAWEDFQTIMSAIYNVLEPVVKAIIDFVRPIVEFKINNDFIKLELAFKAIEDYIGGIAALINGDFDDAWRHLKELFVDNFINAEKEKFQAFSDVIKGITGFDLSKWVKDAWENITAFWSKYIAPIFTLKWWEDLGKTCMNGIITGFEAGINGIIWLFEGMINFVVNGLNGLIDGISNVSGAVGDLLGQDWRIPHIPNVNFGRLSIPRLAQGAVIPPNREFLAVLGDQKQGTNIEAPVDLIKQKVMEAMIEMGGNFSGGGSTEVVLEIDGREFGRAVVEQGNRESRRIGTRLVIA